VRPWSSTDASRTARSAFRGSLERLPAADSDAYFATRPRESRLGAWASPQSRTLPGRDALEESLGEIEERWEGEEDIPRPEHWGGFLVRPETVEFWQGQRARLHDRFLYTREPANGWRIERLAP
jgi:pyridoxamine 5'-phosphate oxidase